MTASLPQEATRLANKLCQLANETGDPRIRRIADLACERERRRYDNDLKERLASRKPIERPYKIGKADTKDRPRAGFWRRRGRKE